MISQEYKPFILECDKILDSAEDGDFRAEPSIKSGPCGSCKFFTEFLESDVHHTSLDRIEVRIEYFLYISGLQFFERDILFLDESFPRQIEVIDSLDPSIRINLEIIGIESHLPSESLEGIGRDIIEIVGTEFLEGLERCLDDMLFSIIILELLA